MELTKQEELAIELLKKAARHWPDSLWILAADSRLYVMRKDKNGKKAIVGRGNGFDPDFILESINVEADGGDW